MRRTYKCTSHNFLIFAPETNLNNKLYANSIIQATSLPIINLIHSLCRHTVVGTENKNLFNKYYTFETAKELIIDILGKLA